MDELRFDGRVAIVTGAGRGIGRAYAHLLAARGARVVVNDLGGSMAGTGADPGPAATVAGEIEAAGGTAIADAGDVATEAGAAGLVETALDRFGRIDILVNNAGIMRWAGPPDVSVDDLQQHLGVHLVGSFATTVAAWPHLVAQGYGRVVLTTSAGLFGLPANTAYAAAKGGVVGLARSLATAGARHGIRVNLVAPAAWTRMAGAGEEDASRAEDPMAAQLDPDLVAPMVAVLAHEDCPVTGEIYAAGGGRFARIFLAATAGHVVGDRPPTPEDVVAHWAAINDESSYVVPADLNAWSAAFLAHLSAG